MESVAALVVLGLAVMAVVSISRDRNTRGLATLVWIAVTLVLPIVGPILWFSIGKRYRYGIDGEEHSFTSDRSDGADGRP